MAGPSVSVLMPTYKHQAYIAQAIESVLAQRFDDFELVITDDHSPDQTYAIAEAYARKDPRVRVFRNPQNLGLAANYTRCLQNAHPESRYFIILPSDDWWMPETLEVLVATAEQNPQATFVHADGYKVKEDGLVPYLSIFRHLPPQGLHRGLRELYLNNYIMVQTTLVRRGLFQRFHCRPFLFDPDYVFVSDYELWLELLGRGAQAYYLPRPLAYFREHPESHTIPKHILPRMIEEVAMFQEKLPPSTPPDLDPYRHQAVVGRLAAIGFLYLEAKEPAKAQPYLERAARESPKLRWDVMIARMISRLPMPKSVRAQLWYLVLEAVGVEPGMRISSAFLRRWGQENMTIITALVNDPTLATRALQDAIPPLLYLFGVPR
ncbi:glycosyltransferase family 2 protein [Allomeiothermus silvanus]|uniref:glycosyltransferase family 2 protein n=1 Tax=Allomeiothermus silvanus TaxID=52022 RepID=UPI0023EFC10A|nr:glycosyltransferase family 2 protein [Allomeiothermus silvanus]